MHPSETFILNDKELLIITEGNRLKKVDIDTMTVSMTYQGTLHKYNKEIVLVNGGKGEICFS